MSEYLEFRECAGCGELFLVQSPFAHRAKWCSDRCRKQTLYSTPCVDCGAPTNGSDGRGAHQRCQACNGQEAARRERDRAAPQRELIERLWREGWTSQQIAERVGVAAQPKGFVSRCRQRGYDLPLRHPGSSAWHKAHPEHMERARQARRAAA